MMNKYLTNKNWRDCCGCSACVEACPKACISMKPSPEGFLYPELLNENCIDCGLCAIVCPIECGNHNEMSKTYYAAYNKDEATIVKSSSGGVFPEVAKYVLNDGGIVFGAFLDEDHQLKHIAIELESDLQKVLSSKYIQSDMGECFTQCREFLNIGRKVLFSGTPCQIQGLKNFLRKDYSNLYTVDVICHGIPSQKMFDAYVAFLEKKHNAMFVDIDFRDKKRNGWSITLRYTMQFKNGRKKDYYLISKLSEYFMAFLNSHVLRESCYSCPFSSMNRPGDITLGDFWGYQVTRPELKHRQGLSLVLVNSSKGDLLMQRISKKITLSLVDENSIKLSENKNLYTPSKRPGTRYKVYEELDIFGFDEIARRYLRRTFTLRNYLKNYMPVALVRLLSRG